MHSTIRWNKCDPYLKCKESASQEVEWRFVKSGSAIKTQLESERCANNKVDQLLIKDPALEGNDKSSRGLKREAPKESNLPKVSIKWLKSSYDAVSDVNTQISPYDLVPTRL